MKKMISVFLIVLLVVVLVLFAFGVVSVLTFWIFIGVIWVIAYKVIPRMTS